MFTHIDPIRVRRIKKEYFDGTHRVTDPKKTLEKIKPLMAEIGVTEVEDITHLDRLNIPVYSAIRPGARIGATKVHAGKGTLPIHAEVSAMMEAIERHSAEYRGENMIYESFEGMGLASAIDPADLILPRNLESSERLHWTPSWDVLNEEEIYVPSNAVYHPYDPVGMAQQLFRSDTNGLASGNVIEEAILHATFEVIERDALSDAENARSLGRRITIDRDGPAKDLLDTFEENGVQIHLWLIDAKTDVPTVAAAADDTVTKDPLLLVMGSGTHLDPEIAVLRALTEVAQSRGSSLQGAREDPKRRILIEKAGYERLKRINSMWFKEDVETVALSEIPDRSTEYIDEDLDVTLEELAGHTERVCVCDLSRTPVPVVRVVIPGLEVSYMDKTRTRNKQAVF